MKTKAVTDEQRKVWGVTMTVDLMSSEESESDSDEATFIVRPLPWRSSKVNSFFESLDKKHTK